MADGKQKLVMVPGTGVVAFPGDMEDERVAAAIRAFRSQKAADQAAKSHPLNRQHLLTTEESEHARQLRAAQPLSSAIPHLPAWLSTPSTELGRQAGNWLSGQIGKVLGAQLPDIDTSKLSEEEAETFRQAHPIAGGLAHGISDIANSLTTPASTALLLTAPESKLMSGLFSLQALHGAYKDAQAAREAYRQGNNEEATRYATESILGGAMGLASGAHAVAPIRGPQGEILPPEATPQPEFPVLPPPAPVTLEGKTGGFALPEYDEGPVANYQLIYKSPAADPEDMNRAVNELVRARESKGWSDPNATDEEMRAAKQSFYAAADQLGKLREQGIGQIRQIPSGEKILYLTRAGLQDLSAGLRGRAPDPEYSLNGVSIRGRYIPIVQANLAALKTPHSEELTKLLSMGAGPDGTVTVSAIPNKNETLSNALSRLREELNHGWQKQFSDQMGNHLPSTEFRSLNVSIPDQMSGYLHQHGYPEDSGDNEANQMRVLEASAKMMSGAPSEFGLTPDEAANYLFQYFDAVTRQHGPQALDELVHTTTLARNIKRDYANARYPSRGSQGQGTLPGLPARGQGRAQTNFGAPGRGTAPVTGPPVAGTQATPSLAALREEAEARRPSLVSGQTANLSYRAADESQPFYLKSDQIIDQKMKGPMNGPQVLQMLRNNGVKEDELETTGLADLLSEDRKFTPQEVKEFAEANPIQIEEISRGANPPTRWKPEDIWVRRVGDAWIGRAPDLNELVLRSDVPEERAKEELAQLLSRDYETVGETKYGQYTEPGGQNYREILMTLPSAAKRPAQAAYDDFVRKMQRKYLNGGQWAQKISASEEAERQRLSAAVRNEREGETDYRSPHWDEPNVLVHFRVNDRTLPNGKKVLHVEEIQSDWAQKGRKEGFAPSPKVARTIPLKAEHKDGYWEVTTGDGRFVTNAYESEAPTEETAIALARHRLEHEPRRTGFGGAVPSMPFAKTWHELAMRRILKYAVDHGYEGVSWTPGEKQAGRYDLSKKVDRIAVIPQKSGARAVRIEPKDGTSIKLMVDKDGIVTPAFSYDDQFDGKNIADVVGKEVADKIMGAEGETTLRAPDLVVGGAGMRGFYDKIVPDYLNKIGKRFGAKVGTAATNVQALAKPVYRYEGPELNPEGIKALYNEIKEGKRPDTELAAGTNFVNRSKLSSTLSYIYGEMIDHGLSYNEAVSKTLANSQPLIENFAKEMGGKAIQKTHQTTKFPFLPITPEMRSAFGEPMALFNQTRKPSIEASKAAITGTALFTLSQAEHWERLYRALDFKTEQEARDFMFRRLEHNDQQSWAYIFGKNGPEKNRKIADTVPLHRVPGGKWKIGPKPKAEPVSTERLGSGEVEDNAPSVSWFAKDLHDTSASVTPESILRDYNQPKDRKAVVYQSYVPVSDLPEPKLAEEQDPEEDRATYPWEDFSFRSRSGGPPPVKLLVKPNGKVEIMDGNHRIKYWTDQGYDSIPAWVIDQRKGVKVAEPEMNQTRRPQAAAGAGTLNDLMEEAKRRAPAPSAPQSMEDMVGRRINTANAEDQDLSRAAHIENGEIVAYHLTDNPDKVQNYLESGKPLHEGGRAAEHDELGPGLYASDVPSYWMGRSTGKYGFLDKLTPEQADKLADAVQNRIDNAGPGYLSKSEVETAHRYIDQFRKDHHGDTLVLLAGQPYNVDFWKPGFLKSIGIEPSKQPEAVEVRAKGNFAEVKNYLRPAEWKALKDAGFDGAWVRAGFSTEPQLVIWNRNAITKFGDWKPSADITMNQTRNAPPLFHGSPHELSVLQPGTMLTPDKAWVAGYTTKMDWNTGKEGFSGKVYEAKAPSGNNLVIDGSLHQVEDKLLQLGREIGATSGGLPGIARAVADHFGYDAIVGKRPDGKLTGAIVLREHPIAGTHDPLAAVNEAMRSGEPVAENLQSLAKSPVNTPEFRRWFGNSKITDEDGSPKVVYHGTGKDFSTFEQRGGVVSTIFGSEPVERTGYFFSDNPAFASGFADLDRKRPGANVMPVYLSIKNPANFAKGPWPDEEPEKSLIEKGWSYRYLLNTEPWELFDGEDGVALVDALKSLGYDGAIFEESLEGQKSKNYVAFYPEQIKSALGNRGTYDPTNPDITMNQVRATKETAKPKVQDLMAEALRRRPTQPTLEGALKDVAARGPSVVP